MGGSLKHLFVCAQSCLMFWDPLDWSPPGSSVHGIFQARLLEWVVTFYFKGSSDPGINAVNAGVCPGSSQVERAHFLWVNTRSGVAGSQGSCDSHFLRRLRSVFCSSRTVCICTSSAQVPFSLHSHQLLSVVLLITAILTGVSWYLTVVLLCIFLMINGVEHLFI